MAEQAEHTQVCEHCEDIFSFNLRQKWTLHGFHEAALCFISCARRSLAIDYE